MKDYSQHGEQIIIRDLVEELGIDGGWIVECGAWDGKCFSNVFSLIVDGNFQAVDIEGDKGRFKKLLVTAEQYPSIIPINSYVDLDKNKLELLLEKTTLPKEFEILNIDIDSIDYQIWDSLKKYSPKIVIIEYQPRRKEDFIDDGTAPRGSSKDSLIKLGESKGYSLRKEISCNLIFVKND